jgi:hypothetical protein
MGVHNSITNACNGRSQSLDPSRRVKARAVAVDRCAVGRLSLPLDCTSRRDDARNDLWIDFKTEDTADTRLAWHAWLEAFELLDLLASSDSRACWNILLDLAGHMTELTHLGCSWSCARATTSDPDDERNS